MKVAKYYIVLQTVIAVTLLAAWPPKYAESQHTYTTHIQDSVFYLIKQSASTEDLNVILSQKISEHNNFSKELLLATLPLKKADNKLTLSFKKLEEYIDKKENSIDRSKSILVLVKKKKTLWQKVKLIFKNKKHKS